MMASLAKAPLFSPRRHRGQMDRTKLEQALPIFALAGSMK
jgi:hypothetical protein